MSEPSDNIWTATDRESERWRIQQSAGRERRIWAPGGDSPYRGPFGFERRSDIGLMASVAAMKLAAIQREYDERGADDAPDLGMRAAMILWPLIMDPAPFKSRPWCRSKILEKRSERRFVLFQILAMAAPEFSTHPPHFDIPRLIIRERKRTERTAESRSRSSTSRAERQCEIIGRAVVMAYRSDPPGRRSIDAVCKEIARLRSVEGIAVREASTVKTEYHKFRKLARDRGYADSRAWQAEYHSEPWPNDQVWLDDFPPA